MIRDHSGFTIQELYVTQRYTSFKEEILNYHLVTIKQYAQDIMDKAQHYMETETTKSIFADAEKAPPHYGIYDEDPLRIQDLMSLIMYTDFTNLSSNFTATFRKKHPFESIESVKRRNSKYWWWSKTLRETIEIFGESKWNSNLKGPFFTGMSFVMTMPQFLIRLCLPVSTSMHIEVATKFSGEDGLIITLNVDNTAATQHLRAFDCSWFSRFKEEDER